jgi:cytochrome c oxidase subunit 3
MLTFTIYSHKDLVNSSLYRAELHGFHLVRPSPWPFLTSIILFQFVLSLLAIFREVGSVRALIFFFVLISLIVGMWFRDIVIEGTFQGFHTSDVQRGLRYGMCLFLLSEFMFFFSFFWCFFHVALSPSIWIGCVWPPVGIIPLNPLLLPLLNTIVLVSSGIAATYAHKCMLRTDGRQGVIYGLIYAIGLGILFTYLQLKEYMNAEFSINDGIYGSIFYVATGFHGVHVIIGTTALFVCLIRHYRYHFTVEHHLGFEFSLWYWHFVDVIWIFSYLIIYIWGWKF